MNAVGAKTQSPTRSNGAVEGDKGSGSATWRERKTPASLSSMAHRAGYNLATSTAGRRRGFLLDGPGRRMILAAVNFCR